MILFLAWVLFGMLSLATGLLNVWSVLFLVTSILLVAQVVEER